MIAIGSSPPLKNAAVETWAVSSHPLARTQIKARNKSKRPHSALAAPQCSTTLALALSLSLHCSSGRRHAVSTLGLIMGFTHHKGVRHSEDRCHHVRGRARRASANERETARAAHHKKGEVKANTKQRRETAPRQLVVHVSIGSFMCDPQSEY